MSATDLRYSQTQPASTALRFGATGGPAPVYHVASMVARVPLVVQAALPTRQTYFATINASVDSGAVATLPTGYDNAVNRHPHAWIAGGWSQAAALAADTAVGQASAQRRECCVAVGFLPGARRRAEVADVWEWMSRGIRPSTDVPWANASALGVRAEAVHGDLSRAVRPALSVPFDAAMRYRADFGDRWITLLRHRRPDVDGPFGEARRVLQTLTGIYESGLPIHVAIAIPWESARRPSPGVSAVIVVPPLRPPCYNPQPGEPVILLFREPVATSGQLRFRCPSAAPGAGETIVIPIRKAYIMINDIAMIRRENNLFLPALALSINIDADSWTWGWSARLPARYLDDVLPATPGAPVEFEAVINGVHWYLLAEKVQRERGFTQDRVAISGRGIAAELGAPYAAAVSRTNTIDRNAQQLMEDAMMINGVGIGWTLDFNLTDWLVPAGVWSHSGSHIEAVARVAEAAGGYVQAHRTSKVLAINPRYPVAPWAWNTVTPDFSLPAAFTTRESVEWVENPDYNAIWISGEGDGILAGVTRHGTAGDLPAPMIVDALTTHADAARQRGTAILGAAGRQQRLTLETPIMTGVGIYPVGSFVQFADGTNSRLGIVRSLAINAGKTVRQTIEVECHG